MKILTDLIKQTIDPSRPVETAKVVEMQGSKALLETERGQAWARTNLALQVGTYVSFARIGTELQVLATAKKSSVTVKIVRV